jgi:DNA polymerase III delta prime subunit
MTSFILIAQSKEKRKQYITEFLQKNNIDQFDLTIIEKDESTKNLQSLGIQDVKNLQKKLYLKPLKSTQKVVTLDDAQLLTIEAQNALLKMLEEPPEHTFIFLGSTTTETLLSTIISRCKIIELETHTSHLTSEEEKELVIILGQLPKMKIGDRLKKAEILTKNKDDAVTWLEKMILTARQQLLKSPNPKRAQYYSKYINKFQTTHTQLKTTNANARLTLEQMLLNIES